MRDVCCVRRGCVRGNPVENVPPEHFQTQGISSGTQGGAVLFAPPSKSCRFSHPPSPCARSMAQGVSLSADSDLEGTCPLRTPRQLRSVGSAFSGTVFQNLFVSARYFLLSAFVGTRRAVSDSFARNKNEKTAFRGRSEQDRSALCPACCYMILKTFRQNVFNGIPLSRNRRTRHAVSLGLV